MNFDFHPTPRHLADRLVGLIENSEPETIADFSAGEGSLLLSAQSRWPSALKIATDIQTSLVNNIRSSFPAWHAGRCDFLSDTSVRSCKALRDRKGTVDVILLNPPFSSANSNRKPHQGGRPPSIALEFLERATRYASLKSEICAILPASCLHNEKDRHVRARIESTWKLEVVGHAGRRAFADCFASSSIVHMKRRDPFGDSLTSGKQQVASGILTVRGSVHMHLAQPSNLPSAAPLVHSTNLKDGKLSGEMPTVLTSKYVKGPAVLIHRVGRPSIDKISILPSGMRVALSDCVIALPTHRRSDSEQLKNTLVKGFQTLASAYVGTGAPFITLSRLEDVLAQLIK